MVIDAEGNPYISRHGIEGESWPWVGVYGGLAEVAPVRPLRVIHDSRQHWQRIDPPDCGCTDCITGWSRPARPDDPEWPQ